MQRIPTTAGFFMLQTKQTNKISKTSETRQYCNHKLKSRLILTYVSSRCCSNVDSIISSRKQQLNFRFLREVLLFILKSLVGGSTSGYRQMTVTCMTGAWEDQIIQRTVEKQQQEALVLVKDYLRNPQSVNLKNVLITAFCSKF